MEDIDFSGLQERFRERFFEMMLRREEMLPETAEKLMSWEHSGFHLGRRERKIEAARIERTGGFLSITDAIHLLNYLFLGGSPPRAPFPECAPAPGGDDAWCVREACRG